MKYRTSKRPSRIMRYFRRNRYIAINGVLYYVLDPIKRKSKHNAYMMGLYSGEQSIIWYMPPRYLWDLYKGNQ